MKIDGFGSIISTGNTGKRKGVSGVGSFADLLAAAETEETSQTSASSDVSAMTALNSLLALQEIPDEYVQRKKLVSQGNTMLDTLEKFRRQLLGGSLSLHVLREINQQITQQKQVINDPRLNEVIADIELRAAVELAKVQQAVDHSRDAN